MSTAAAAPPRPKPGPPPSPPQGFRLRGVAAGVKSDPTLHDVTVIASERPCAAAGVFTQNRVTAAPVQVSRRRVPSDTVRALVVNSGNANACTGDQGWQDALRMTRCTAGLLGCADEAVLVCSTGVIGERLPIERIERGIASAVEQLGDDAEALESAARGMMTTDTLPKWSGRKIATANGDITVVGLAKGAAMLAPRMATMLAVVLTDAPLRPELADSMLRSAVDGSFNCISIDGHTSTNDTVLLLSSGATAVAPTDDWQQRVAEAVAQTCVDLAKAIIADAEGGHHRVTIDVEGARNRSEAVKIARAIADSPLVKTAMHGADPNWGRIVSAAGYAGVEFDPEDVTLRLADTLLYQHGAPVPFDDEALSAALRANFDVAIRFQLNHGAVAARFWGCDLSEDYVRLNAEYRT